MKIQFPCGAYLEADDGPRDTPFHRRIVRTTPIPQTQCGHHLVLECGHRAMAFGDLAHAGGVVLCSQCRDARVN